MHFFNLTIPKLEKAANRMLQGEMALVLLAAVCVLISYLSEAESDPVLAALRFSDAPAYILASLSLAISTSLLCDLAERRRHR